MKKHPKMDRLLISKQKWELNWIVEKMKNEGIIISIQQILEAVKQLGRSRRKVYKFLRTWK